MNFETVEHCGRIHVVKNGVESWGFVTLGYVGNYWLVYRPVFQDQTASLETALAAVAARMDTWHAVIEAAVRLAELGKVTKPPHPKTMCRWAREGRFLGAIKVGQGQGGSWRISETALREFTKRGGEKKWRD